MEGESSEGKRLSEKKVKGTEGKGSQEKDDMKIEGRRFSLGKRGRSPRGKRKKREESFTAEGEGSEGNSLPEERL